MSGRNNRIVRNRDRSSHFLGNTKTLKIVASVIAIALLVVIVFVFFSREKEDKKIVCFVDNSNISYEYFLLTSGEKLGVIDKKGNLILDAKYDQIDIPNPSKPVFICKTAEETRILNEKNEEILKQYEDIEAVKPSTSVDNEMEKQVLKYKKNGLYGLIDLEGNVVIEAIYQEISSLNDKPESILVKKDEKYGIVDANGNYVIDLAYDSITSDGYYLPNISYEKTGYIVAKKASDGINFGYINYEGECLLDTKYESIERALKYDEDTPYLIVMQKGKKGVFKNTKKIIDLNYQSIHYSELSKVFVVEKNGKYGFYKTNGKSILKPEYTQYSIAGNYISVEKDGEKKLFDINGNLVNTTSYTKMIETENPAYFIAEDENGYHSIISKDINIDKKYSQVSYAFDNYFIFTDENSKSGVVNAAINEIEIEPKYDFVILIEGTCFLQAVDGMNGYTDIYSNKLEKVLTMKDCIVENLENGYSIVYSGTDMKYINQNGEIVENTEVYPDKQLYSFKQNDKWGFSDSNGKIVVQCQYDLVTELNEYGFCGIKKGEKWGVMNERGEVIVEPNYELDTYFFPEFIGKYLLNKSETTYCEDLEKGEKK